MSDGRDGRKRSCVCFTRVLSLYSLNFGVIFSFSQESGCLFLILLHLDSHTRLHVKREREGGRERNRRGCNSVSFCPSPVVLYIACCVR
jgi:hypothetical protein